MKARIDGRLALLVTLACAPACGETDTLPPEGQLLVYFDTDAPLPPPAGQTASSADAAPLFDRLRVEVFRPNESSPCGECTHEFDVDRATVGEGRASVGIKPPAHATGYAARVRLFRAAFVELGQPRRDATIDVTVALPPVETEGITPVTVFLRTDDVGHPIGSRAEPAAPEPGLPRGRVGTWPGARRVGCAEAPAPFEVCVPGGAFWMGNPRMETMQVGLDDVVLRLVVLSPFYLDKTEVLVPTFRAARIAAPKDPIPDSDHYENGLPQGVRCTYTAELGNFESVPVNCLSPAKASEFCRTRGGDLPSEAQLQYVAGALEGRLYPWGNDPPTCDDAVFARVRQLLGPDSACGGGSMSPPGSGGRDRLDFGGGTVVDIVGNLAEYARDDWNLQKESCWSSGAVLYDPVCTTPTRMPDLEGAHTVMGGSFVSVGGMLASAFRQPSHPFPPSPRGGDVVFFSGTGFRCARPALP